MPIYEYECAKCGQFEVMQRITESALTTCEKCGGSLTKLVSQSSFALKGGGWYKDLYSSASKSVGTGSSSSSSASSSASSSSSSSSSSTSSSTSGGGSKSAA